MFKSFEKIWSPKEESALKELQNFIKNRIIDYSDSRNFPSIVGTSKLSPYIKFGQIHVETIWKECTNAKKKTIGTSKFLTEIGWREFNHTLINHFPHMLKNNYSKKFDNFPEKVVFPEPCKPDINTTVKESERLIPSAFPPISWVNSSFTILTIN